MKQPVRAFSPYKPNQTFSGSGVPLIHCSHYNPDCSSTSTPEKADPYSRNGPMSWGGAASIPPRPQNPELPQSSRSPCSPRRFSTGQMSRFFLKNWVPVQHKFAFQNPRTLTISEASLLNLNQWWHTRHASQLSWHSMTCIVKSVSLGCRCLQCGVSDISHLVTLNSSIPKFCKLSPSPLNL